MPTEREDLHASAVSGGEWQSFGGLRYKHEGGGRFLFQSRSNPSDSHLLDIHEGKCSCWGFSRSSTGICIHIRAVAAILKRLRYEQYKPHTDQ